MRIQFVTIASKGVPNQERIHLRVFAEVDMAFYIVLLSVINPGNPTTVFSGLRPAFWFPTHLVRNGDNVILYTGEGRQVSTPRADGGTDHFFYWGLKSTMFNSHEACVVISEVNSWMTGY